MAVVFNTDGCGLWSNIATSVRITKFTLGYCNEEQDFGELRVYFNTEDWTVEDDGLIYTDDLFMQELRDYFAAKGFPADKLNYSEQGMQGYDYVSCDITNEFVQLWIENNLPTEEGVFEDDY
jgi:hypothetical protein